MNEDVNSTIVEKNFPRAGLLRRMASLLYDVFLVVAIWFLLGYIVQLLLGTENNQIINGQLETDPFIDNLLFLLMISSCIFFYGWFWMKGGQTLGMLAWRLRVESIDGKLINFKQVLIRWSASWPAFFIFGIGYFWIYIDHKGDALHDKVSGSKVVVIPKSERPF